LAPSRLTPTIGGDPAGSNDDLEVVDPASGETFARAPVCTREELDAAMDAAACAFSGWRADEARRRVALRDAAHVLESATFELARLVTAEQGKPLRESLAEIGSCVTWLRYFAELELPREVIQDDENALVEVVRRPLGVVAAITPWNFPLATAVWKIARALRAGDTMVLKPSQFAPLTVLRVGELLRAVLPPGVLNVVSGGDGVGAWMATHPVPRKISFTGSVETGKQIAHAAAGDLKRMTLELGGNDPAIILDDIEPAAVAKQLFWGAFYNCGQLCTGIKRIYAPEQLYERVVEAIAVQARAAKVASGFEDGVRIGPIATEPQLERVVELVADAVAGGARVAAGGARLPLHGNFFAPTVLADVTDGMRIVDEEQFGPALPVIRYRDLDDALGRANATHFGLGGSVWGADGERAAAVASQLESGTAWVNTHAVLTPFQPFAGAKWSGVGVENGRWGLEAFTELQVVHQARG
jgi:acyl-CoA reductase-like NAD-dependent aldehyde dehydrogenase